jgi:hypothetical protein
MKKTYHVEAWRTKDYASVKETLRPWWVLTRYCGLLPDWCCHPHNIDRKRRAVAVTLSRYTGVTFVFSFVFSMMIFQLSRTVVAIQSMTTVHSVIPFLLWLSAIPLVVVTQIWYIARRRDFLAFFKDWDLFVKYLAVRYSHQELVYPMVRKPRILVYTSKLVTLLILVVGLSMIIFNFPDAPYLLSNFQALHDVISMPILGFIHLLNMILVLGLTTLCETVPALVFFHFQCQIHVLQREFDNVFKLFNSQCNYHKLSGRLDVDPGLFFAAQLRQLFEFYETVRRFVGRANSLFGVLLFLNHGMRLIVICIMLYSVLYLLQSSPVTAGIYLINFCIHLYELVSSTLLTAQLYRASDRLRSHLAVLLTRYWDSIPKEERKFLVHFNGRIQTDPLAATPLGLYNVTPSFLLTVASLGVTYVIILLQSK